MSDERADDETAQLACAGFGCGLLLMPVFLIAAIAALFAMYGPH